MKRFNECPLLEQSVTKNFTDINVWLNTDCHCSFCDMYTNKFENSKETCEKNIGFNSEYLMRVKVNDKLKNNIEKQIKNSKMKKFVLNKKK